MASQYTDQQRTRIVDRKKLERHARTSASIGDTQAITQKPKLLEGISIAQLIAGAGAAVTSMVLASEIGIAGSVIGAAVSSVVTVIASQLYRNFLSAGARKLKDGYDALGRVSDLPRPGRNASDETTLLEGRGGAAAGANVRGARIAPAKLQARAAAERSATQRKVVVFSIVIAVVMVIACTAAILIGTAGEGIGTKTEPLIPRVSTTELEDKDQAHANPSAGDHAANDTTSHNATTDSQSTTDTPTSDTGAGGADATGQNSSTENQGGSTSDSSSATGGNTAPSTGTDGSNAQGDSTQSGTAGNTGSESTSGTTTNGSGATTGAANNQAS